MEWIDKEKWSSYKKGQGLEAIFFLPIYLPGIFIIKGAWYLAVIVILFTVLLYLKSPLFKVAREKIKKFGVKYFSIVAIVTTAFLLRWLYPEITLIMVANLVLVFLSAVTGYFVVVRKVKKAVYSPAG